MQKKIIYRRELLWAVDAFLEKTPASHARAQHIVQRCDAALQGEEKQATLNDIIWGAFVSALTDSIFYSNEKFLRETREMLLGNPSSPLNRAVFSNDYRPYFTTDEKNLYTELMSMLDFIVQIPFAKIHEATYQAWQNKTTWATIRTGIPEAMQAEEIDKEYVQRKDIINDIFARISFPGDIGDEKIYHLVLREITSILTAIRVGHAAIASGYPVLDGPYTEYPMQTSPKFQGIDVTDCLSWAKKSLEALAGKGNLFISWRLGNEPTFDGDLLIVSLH